MNACEAKPADMTGYRQRAERRLAMAPRLLLTGCLLLLAPLYASAAMAQADPGPTTFTVRVIEASHGAAPAIDPSLQPILSELKHFPDYNKFAVLRTEPLLLKLNQRGVVKLPDGAEFAITLLDGPVGRVRHKVEMPHTRTTRSVAYGGRTLDVLPGSGKVTIVWTTVEAKH